MLLVVIVISFLHRTAAIHSPPRDHSIFPLHALPASVTCASQDPYWSRHLCPGHSVSQTGKLQGQKGAATSSPPVQLGEKVKKREERQVGRAKRLRAKEAAHEQSRADIGVAIQHSRPSVLPWLAGLQPQAQLSQGQTLCTFSRCPRRAHMPEKSQGLEDLLLELAGKPQTFRLREAGSEQKSASASCSFLSNSFLPFCGHSRGMAELWDKSSLW